MKKSDFFMEKSFKNVKSESYLDRLISRFSLKSDFLIKIVVKNKKRKSLIE